MTARVSGRSESCDSARRFCRTDLVDDTGTYTGTGSYEVTRDFVVIKILDCASARWNIFSAKHCLWRSSRIHRTVVTSGHPGCESAVLTTEPP